MSNSEKMILAFIFDSGKCGSDCYGDVVFENMMKGKELSKNEYKMIISLGDIAIYKRYIDIEPYVTKDEYCTIDFGSLTNSNYFKDYPFCWIVEDIQSNSAILIDKRLKESFGAYVGMFRIDVNNTQIKKQFWKEMVRDFSLYQNTIICFQDPDVTDVFGYLELAEELGYAVTYDKDAEYSPIENSPSLQSSYIKCDNDLSLKHPKEKDIDRDLMTLNFSLRQEIQISGVLLWKSINDIDKVYLDSAGNHNDYLIEYPFLALYHSSQGIERIQKAIIEIICKKNHILEIDKDKVYELLLSHSHNKLNEWIENKEGIHFSSNCKKLINILMRFYGTVRYARYSDDGCTKTISPEYELLLELKSANSEDLSYGIKNNFGKFLGELANTYYALFYKLCGELNIYAYELETESAASLVYYVNDKPKNLYQEFLKIQQAKKELLYWLMKQAKKYPKHKLFKVVPLNFDPNMIEYYMQELLYNAEFCQQLYDEFDYLYDELYSEDKELWKDRKQLIHCIIANPQIEFGDRK